MEITKNFKCPICGKEIEIKMDDGYIYHRPWMFHIAIDHSNLFQVGVIPEEDILLWLYYPWVLDGGEQKELLRRLRPNGL